MENEPISVSRVFLKLIRPFLDDFFQHVNSNRDDFN